ncbi:MAG: 50S ribosomal protein L29 [Hyphomicrobiaceae bacterium hypho_1]
MSGSQFRDLSLDQLDDRLVELKREQFNMRFQTAAGQFENTARIRKVRRDIARIKTIAREHRIRASRIGGNKQE